MANPKKTVLIAALILVGVGILITVAAMALNNFDFGKMSSLSFEMKTFDVTEDFSRIYVDDVDCNVRILRSQDGSCKVVCPESEDGRSYHTVAVSDGVLRIERHDNRKWYQHISVSFDSMDVEVYLPENEYKDLKVNTASGNIEVSEGFTFENAELESASGRVYVFSNVKDELEAKSVSGKVEIGHASPKKLEAKSTSGSVIIEYTVCDELKAKSASGWVTLINVRCKELDAETTSGEIELIDVIADEKLSAESTSGGVELDGCDGGAIYIETSSGSVKGTLLSDKIFITDTSSGRVDVPRSASGGECEIITTSGNIVIKIK